ncbi:hypothetical protein B5F20_02760 [Clostridium perfringens]|uniref:recombinase family protein n=1 Tax=Clostridium perfringens TaxID=1502 RepID=UPI000B3930D8|nr:recombinase family protein [Clostridium perfringens]OUP47913.1 hypothetical protein B5F20_02760 [Clostridium perfringens]
MENLKMLNKVINDSQNYAVIYARISSKNENNSINAQIKLGEDVINKNNLLLYDTYIDKISGKTTSPKERKGFSRLLEDAKAGLFKTLVIYRLDRLVRRYDDWIETKKILNKLGIKILFSDTNQALLENSPQSEFFQNFSVMIAEMEPDTISLRASQGRIFRRKSGAYTSPKAPFGYIKQESNDRRKSKSIFIQEPIKLAFIKYIFFVFHRLIIEEKRSDSSNPQASINTLYNSLQNTLEYIEANIDLRDIPLRNNTKYASLEAELFGVINKYIENTDVKSVKKEISEVKFYYLFSKGNTTKKNSAYLSACLRNPVYAGCILLDSNHPFKGLSYSTDEKTGITSFKERLDSEAFVNTNNLVGIIPSSIFKTVYSYLTYKSLIKIDRTPNFLLKGSLICSKCNKKLKLIDDNYLSCKGTRCHPFLKYDLLKFIIDKIIDNCLSISQTPLEQFINKLSRKIEIKNQNIKYQTLNKYEAIYNYLSSNDVSYVDKIHQKDIAIKSYVSSCNKYRTKLSYLNQLFDEVNKINKKCSSKPQLENNSVLLKQVKEKIVNHIMNNEEFFIPIFSEIIKEIKVDINYEQSPIEGKLNIRYEFTP